jgi:hypothetical protein
LVRDLTAGRMPVEQNPAHAVKGPKSHQTTSDQFLSRRRQVLDALNGSAQTRVRGPDLESSANIGGEQIDISLIGPESATEEPSPSDSPTLALLSCLMVFSYPPLSNLRNSCLRSSIARNEYLLYSCSLPMTLVLRHELPNSRAYEPFDLLALASICPLLPHLFRQICWF